MNWHRLRAATMLAQLPETYEDAVLTLDALRELVEFLHQKPSRPVPAIVPASRSEEDAR
jgi:hypothetical protein